MKSKTGELWVRNGAGIQGSNEAGEIELYSELTSFSQLSPEEQEALAVSVPEAADEAAHSKPESPAEATSTAVEPAPARIGTGDLLSAFASFADAALTAGSAEPRAGTCPSCGCESDMQDMFCMECGEFFDEPDALEMVFETAQPVPVAGLACGDCREVIAEEEIFCPSCGAVL